MNKLISTIFNYEARGFKITLAFTNNNFNSMIELIRQELYIDLTTCTDDSHMPRAENEIKFVKKGARCVQSETLFTKYPKRLTHEMMKRVTVLINSLNGLSGVHAVMSTRQIVFGKQFKNILYDWRFSNGI